MTPKEAIEYIKAYSPPEGRYDVFTQSKLSGWSQ